ncbi:LTA synthase family protein [Sinorhizobium meliloti WSM1022]|uniref:LTA synthase family protein n=1 Tax=Rhizobium meliloti TaxID=382 RepID=UPI000414AC5F|nr:LTA synthase family protein [Sinorhizobium meliloti]ASQ03869.1 cation tolerance protein CutA [Sinorhizobium meliloti]MCO6423482.1 LTA synthase family protein [Sinorhizobium meliloti]MDW9409357.1 sulfatase-like hydrolase/transferase [Sinorhizobium meliloti]MDW9442094.1 sulfatase-like hydrolase/transferase [Sinorhizobium meliloti]MDW9454513.1 sulfatase-like hydrolase/transferase [Sinorhizobium meliloti]
MARIDSAVSSSQVYADGESSSARYTRTLSGARSALFTLLIAIALVFTVELIVRWSWPDTVAYFADPMRPAWTTVAVFFLAMLGVDALFGREHKAALLIAPLAVVPAFISQQKQVFLSDPLYPTDFLFGRQIMELMPVLVKDRPWTAVGVVAGLIAAIVVGALLLRFAWQNFPKLTRRERLMRIAFALPLLVAFWNIMDYNQFSWIRDRLRVIPIMWDQTENYRHNGFALAFAINLPMANVNAPAGYMADAIDRIPVKPLPAGTTHRGKPDVIVLMSESFWDPTRLPKVKLTPDPMPTIRELQGGNVFSPEFGGMTANVEFEALTGFSNAFLPYGSIPYQQYIRNPIPSLATFFRGEGYVSRAIHPFQGWFWNRTAVYKAFGFDMFRSEENMPAMQKRGIFASDESLTKEIIRQADEVEDPFFFFAVTLQGHGPYEANRYAKNTIKVEGDLPEADRQVLATYAQGVKEADDSLKMLMDWAKERDRETIIVLFGDHLPPLNTVYSSTGYMKGITAERKGPKDQMKAEHETPLVVWSNKTGPKKNIGTISPAFLSYQILKQAGYEHPYYTGFLGKVYDHYRVLDRYMLIRKNGKDVSDWLRQPKVPASLRDYRFLQHDMMFGKRYSTERFFKSHAELYSAGL